VSFHNLKGGDRIRFRMPNGLRLVNGRAVPEFKTRAAKVQPLLVFADHVVVNLGGAYGRPHVVTEENFVGMA
jgi:hypothetical protein